MKIPAACDIFSEMPEKADDYHGVTGLDQDNLGRLGSQMTIVINMDSGHPTLQQINSQLNANLWIALDKAGITDIKA